MYRDDTCAVCGDSLPPDHLYCREHAATVDERLQEIGALAAQVGPQLARLGELLGQIAPETYDWLAEQTAPDAIWPPVPEVLLRMAPEDVEVVVDGEPGVVRVEMRPELAQLMVAAAAALGTAQAVVFIDSCRTAEGANATH